MFDAEIVKKWGDLIGEQRRRMEELRVPYFGGEEDAYTENKSKILAFLEDLITEDMEQ